MKLSRDRIRELAEEYNKINEFDYFKSCVELMGKKEGKNTSKFTELSEVNQWELFLILSDILYGVKQNEKTNL